MHLLIGILRPLLPVKLCDVVDNILNATNNDLATCIGHVNDVVECGEHVLLEHVLVFVAQCLFLPLLLVK